MKLHGKPTGVEIERFPPLERAAHWANALAFVVLAVSGDWAMIPSDWKVTGDEDPRRGIPTTYYASVQLTGGPRC